MMAKDRLNMKNHKCVMSQENTVIPSHDWTIDYTLGSTIS